MTKAVHSVAQPIVCCIGTSVAGQATQFLFERAIVSQGSDWRAISVEVSSDRLKTACDGMLAMHFQGVRFFGDFQTAAVSELATEDKAAQFVGRLSSGIRQNDAWQFWDSVGYAWLEILQRSAPELPYVVWLHGDSRTTRSTFAALSTLAATKPKWLWTEAPALSSEASWEKSLDGWNTEGRIQKHLDLAVCLKLLSQWLTEPEKNKSNKRDSASIHASSDIKGHATGDHSPQLASLNGKLANLAIVSDNVSLPEELVDALIGLPLELIAPTTLKLPSKLDQLPVQKISSTELAVTCEAHDFRRWTGRSVDIQLLQDAYDEYCDF